MNDEIVPDIPPPPPGGFEGDGIDTTKIPSVATGNIGKSEEKIPTAPSSSTVSEEKVPEETPQQKDERENAIKCETFSNKLYNEFHQHYKIIIDKIVENDNKLLVQCKAKEKVYYYLATHVKNNLDKITHQMDSIRFQEPNCINKKYDTYEDYKKDYKPEMTILMDGTEKTLLLQNFGSVEDMKTSIIPFNYGEKYLNTGIKIVGYNDEDDVVVPTDDDHDAIEVDDGMGNDDENAFMGGKKKRKKRKKRKKKINNKTNRRKKKSKNGTKKKKN